MKLKIVSDLGKLLSLLQNVVLLGHVIKQVDKEQVTKYSARGKGLQIIEFNQYLNRNLVQKNSNSNNGDALLKLSMASFVPV